MITSSRLLNLCCVVLIVSSFSFVSEENRISSEFSVTPTHVAGRIIPIGLVIVCCLISVPKRQLEVLRELGRPPFVFWNWYALTATISGFVYGLQPLYSAWKCFEIVVAMLFGATVVVSCREEPDSRRLIQLFKVVICLCYIVCIASLTMAFNNGIGLYLSGQERFELEWPVINPITLSVIGAFALVGGLLSWRRIPRYWQIVLSLIPIATVLLARSRTGLLALLLTTGYAVICSHMSRYFRLVIIATITSIVVAMAISPDLRSNFRLSSFDEFSRGAGRVQDIRGRSSWGECLRLIKSSPLVGYGNIGLSRFMYDYKFSVGDNGALQAIVAGGIIGASPAILFVFYLVWRWILFALQVSAIPSQEDRILFGLSFCAICVSVTKAFTTNSLSASDFALILFIIGAIASQTVGQRISAAKQVDRHATVTP